MNSQEPRTFRYRWFTSGDVNAFFGLMLDNIAGLILIVMLLSVNFGVPTDFSIRHLVPGTAIGVFVGDFIFFLLAFYLAKKSRKDDVTAMPLGLDTPSTFGMALFVLGPAFLSGKNDLGLGETDAAYYMWEIGICSIFLSGIFKLLCAFFSNTIRRTFPRAGLLGSLAAIALVIISFLPLIDVLKTPVVGLIAIAMVLTSLVGRVPLPGKIPGTVAALIVAAFIHYVMVGLDLRRPEIEPTMIETVWLPTEWMQAFQMKWFSRMGDAISYLPVVLPFALATVIGGIDCTESAAAVGDDYPTGPVIGVEAIATLAASFCGGVIQTTPYIGHPAYKAMGGRAAYTLATALFIGSAGVLGFFGLFYQYIPQAAVFPILVFIGLEIAGQSFIATPPRHYPAVAFACVPAIAFLSLHFAGQILFDANVQISASTPVAVVETQSSESPTMTGDPAAVDDTIEAISNAPANLPPQKKLANPDLRLGLETAGLLSNGFILTSLLWASALAMAIDRRLFVSAILFSSCGFLTLFGFIHSPLGNNSIFVPVSLGIVPESLVLSQDLLPLILRWAIGYFLVGVIFVAWGYYLKRIQMYGEIPGE